MPISKAFKLKNPRKGTETSEDLKKKQNGFYFQIKESPEGDWNVEHLGIVVDVHRAFKLKNPRKGTETRCQQRNQIRIKVSFQIKESPEGDWNSISSPFSIAGLVFQIKESPEGDWNANIFGPRRVALVWVKHFQIKESPEGDWN